VRRKTRGDQGAKTGRREAEEAEGTGGESREVVRRLAASIPAPFVLYEFESGGFVLPLHAGFGGSFRTGGMIL